MKKKGIIILFCVLIIIVILLILLQITSMNNKNKATITSPTPVPNQTASEPKIPVFYQPQKTEQMLNTIDKRPSIPPSDVNAKTNLINSLPDNSDILFQSNEFSVYYIRTGDIFQVEINQPNITQTKADAVLWFQQKGFSKESVCNLPVTFYLGSSILDQIKQTGVQFSPIADGC